MCHWKACGGMPQKQAAVTAYAMLQKYAAVIAATTRSAACRTSITSSPASRDTAQPVCVCLCVAQIFTRLFVHLQHQLITTSVVVAHLVFRESRLTTHTSEAVVVGVAAQVTAAVQVTATVGVGVQLTATVGVRRISRTASCGSAKNQPDVLPKCAAVSAGPSAGVFTFQLP